MGSAKRVAELRNKRSTGRSGGSGFDAEYFKKSCAALYELMFTEVVEGVERETATLTIFQEDGRLKFALKDRDTSQTAWGTLDSGEMALESISQMIDDDKVDWRVERSAKRLDKRRRNT